MMMNLLIFIFLVTITSTFADVSVSCCSDTLSFLKTPKKAVVVDINMTEMMLALGLESQIVGVAGVEKSGHLILPEFVHAYRKLPQLSPGYPSLEKTIATGADFVFAGWSYGFSHRGMNPEKLKKFNISSYVLSESCIRIGKGRAQGLEAVFDDVMNLSRIFGHEKQGKELVASLRAREEKLKFSLQKVSRKKVFVYDSGEKIPFTSGKYATLNDLISLAGGENVFNDLASSWETVSWEQVVNRNPEWIIIVDYSRPDANGKIKFLVDHVALKKIPAVLHNRFIILSYAEAVPGIRNLSVAEKIASYLHPEKMSKR